ncbi:MAG: NADH:ubiquinone oxidoreductase subunit 4 (chain M) [Microcella sp.]|uniref:NADH:ubiquinone oxidoreductase subunit 4 (chain M) n=1 Tax=Microcella sp. TaxID=1913979 RepID=UPI0024CDCA39|nr:NADH:ubiquinone oxidoreductase subunit 4 (chain M) [Microcella sp.]UYN84414.1 MAG: NADH:ubiquinone oxidoreductase subunit 4 (chain M) [Microcella sp.]
MTRIIATLVAIFVGLALFSGAAVVLITPVAVQFVESALGRAGDPPAERADGPQTPTESDADFGEVQVFDVLADGSLEPAATGVAAEVWNQFVRIVGADVAGEVIIQYRAGDAPRSDTLAYVYQDQNPRYWTLAVNLATADDPQLLVATLIHEYAHVFSFDHADFDRKAPSCDTLDLFEGCAADDSYLYEFYVAFWAGYPDAVDVENTDPDAAWRFYLAYEDDFVSDYAATNLGEDFAESFMTFVIEDSFEGPSVAAQKLRFFTQYPELVELREHIRAEMAVELGLR